MVETDGDLWATTTQELDGAIWEELSATAELFSVSTEPNNVRCQVGIVQLFAVECADVAGCR